MSPERAFPFGSPEVRTAGFFLLLFTTAGITTAYGGIWFEAQGLSARQIGLVNAIPILMMLMLNVTIGRIADRASDWRQVIIWTAWVAALSPIGLFWATSFWPILLFMAVSAIAQMAMVPVSEAAAIRMTRRRGGNYGLHRALGTVGYLALLVGTGLAAERQGAAVFVPILVCFGVLRALMAHQLPKFRSLEGQQTPGGALHLREAMRPWFVLPLLGWAIIFGSHFILNAFQALLLARQGYGADTIGLLIGLGALSEIAVLFFFSRIAHLAPARVFILIAALASILRWIGFAFEPGLAALIGLQLMHGVTFGLGLIAVTHFIANWTSEGIAAQAQSFSVVLQQGAAFVALAGFGWLVDAMGAQAYLASAGFALLGAVCIAVSLWMRLPEAQQT